MEFADPCVPVETAGCRVVFVHVPEAKAIGRIDRCHAIVAPAAEGVGLAPSAGEHCSFALGKVTWRIRLQAPGITDARKHGWTG